MTINDRQNRRYVFENAFNSMVKYGKKSMMAGKILSRRDEIESSMLKYYESTEEFEKCKYILDFFNDLDKTLRLSLETIDIENL